MQNTIKKIGLIVGEGTGRELADIFKECLYAIAEKVNTQVQVVECEHIFGTYGSLKNQPIKKIEEKKEKDLEVLGTFYKEFYSSGGRVIFKTAINAETLYQFRRIGKAVKVINIPFEGKKLLIVRDETQGFYANDQYEIDETKIEFSGSFSKENLQLVLISAIKESEKTLRIPFETWVAYKHHLFGNVIERWVDETIGEARICQPNCATEQLFQYLRSKEVKDLLIITGNEFQTS